MTGPPSIGPSGPIKGDEGRAKLSATLTETTSKDAKRPSAPGITLSADEAGRDVKKRFDTNKDLARFRNDTERLDELLSAYSVETDLTKIGNKWMEVFEERAQRTCTIYTMWVLDWAKGVPYYPRDDGRPVSSPSGVTKRPIGEILNEGKVTVRRIIAYRPISEVLHHLAFHEGMVAEGRCVVYLPPLVRPPPKSPKRASANGFVRPPEGSSSMFDSQSVCPRIEILSVTDEPAVATLSFPVREQQGAPPVYGFVETHATNTVQAFYGVLWNAFSKIPESYSYGPCKPCVIEGERSLWTWLAYLDATIAVWQRDSGDWGIWRRYYDERAIGAIGLLWKRFPFDWARIAPVYDRIVREGAESYRNEFLEQYFAGEFQALTSELAALPPKISDVAFVDFGCGTGSTMSMLATARPDSSGADRDNGTLARVRAKAQARIHGKNPKLDRVRFMLGIDDEPAMVNRAKSKKELNACRVVLADVTGSPRTESGAKMAGLPDILYNGTITSSGWRGGACTADSPPQVALSDLSEQERAEVSAFSKSTKFACLANVLPNIPTPFRVDFLRRIRGSLRQGDRLFVSAYDESEFRENAEKTYRLIQVYTGNAEHARADPDAATYVSPDAYFYSHWFRKEELKSLLEAAGFAPVKADRFDRGVYALGVVGERAP